MPHVWAVPAAWQSHSSLLPKSCAWCPTAAAAAVAVVVHIPDRTRLVPAWSECAASWPQVVVVAAAAAPAVAAVDSCTRSVPWPKCASSAIDLART